MTVTGCPAVFLYARHRKISTFSFSRYRTGLLFLPFLKKREPFDSLPAPLALETDVAAYNYRYMYFPGDGRRFPWMIFYQSEANLTMMGQNYYEMDLDKVVGLAYWGMIDYLGESRGWPAKGWTDGVFDIALEPKPMAYFLKSFFKEDEPTVHVSIVDNTTEDTEWNGVKFGGEKYSDHWNRQPGTHLTVYAYSNAEEVELLVNGKSQGKRSNTDNPKERNKMRWYNVGYADGYIEAIAFDHGRIVARHRVETSGKAVKLNVTHDDIEWVADGIDLMHVRVHADCGGSSADGETEKQQAEDTENQVEDKPLKALKSPRTPKHSRDIIKMLTGFA